MNEYESIQTLKPIHRQSKNIVFRGNRYPIDFDFLKRNSNYFYNFSQDFENIYDIEISDEFLDITDESFQQFILSCQNEPFSIKISNIISLHHLSCKFDVLNLKNLTNEFIREHSNELIFKMIKYKYSIFQQENYTEIDNKYSMNLTEEEENIRSNFFEYCQKEEFYELPIEFIYRVINNEKFQIENEDEYQKFLIKCLNKYKRKASILFTNVNFNNPYNQEKIFQSLIKDFSEIIDFNMINPIFIIKTSLDLGEKNLKLTSDNEHFKEEILCLTKKIEDKEQKISEYVEKEKKHELEKEKLETKSKELEIKKEELETKNKELEIKNEELEIKSKELETKNKELETKSKELEIQNKELETKNEEYEMTNKEIEKKCKELEIQNEEHFKIIEKYQETENELLKVKNSSEIVKEESDRLNELIKNLKKNDEFFEKLVMINKISDFNELPVRFKQKIINEIKRLPKTESNTTNILSKIENLLLYLSNNGMDDKLGMNILSENDDQMKELKSIKTIKILSSSTDILFNNEALNTPELKQIFNDLSFINIELAYPSASFDSIYKELNQLKIEYSHKMTVTVFITNVDNIDFHFQNDENITSIVLDNTVQTIKGQFLEGSFSGCSSLTQITIPSSVTSIGGHAFGGCSSLAEISIPSSVTSIGDYTFSGCSLLTQISFGVLSSLTSIGNGVFYGCSSLTQISIPSSVTSIGSYSFTKCSSLTNVSFETPSLVSIGNNAFDECLSLTQISIPSSVITIGDYTFNKCSSLVQISFAIPSSLNSIGQNIFNECLLLTQISIPSSIKKIGDYAFKGCLKLDQIIVIPCKEKNIKYVEDKFLIYKTIENSEIYDSLVWVKANLNTITVPPFIKTICTGAFNECSSLKQLSIPSSIMKIEDYAFKGCLKLDQIIIIPCKEKRIEYVEDKFLIYKTIEESEIYDSLIWVKYNLDAITIPPFIKTICTGAFNECSSLKQLSIPSSVTSIGDFAFSKCSSLLKISIPSSVKTIGKSAFFECSSLKQLSIPTSITSIRWNSFYLCSSLTQISIPSSVKTIEGYAFDGCSSLTQVYIPSSVTSIGCNVFNDCSSLTQVSIPSSVTSIESDVFNGCSSLTQISIPSSLFGRLKDLGVGSKVNVTKL